MAALPVAALFRLGVVPTGVVIPSGSPLRLLGVRSTGSVIGAGSVKFMAALPVLAALFRLGLWFRLESLFLVVVVLEPLMEMAALLHSA